MESPIVVRTGALGAAENVIVERPLQFTGRTAPFTPPQPAPAPVATPAPTPTAPPPPPMLWGLREVLAVFAVLLAITVIWYRGERRTGRFDPPPAVDEAWMAENILAMKAELAGAAYHDAATATEAAATLARMAAEKKLAITPDSQDGLRDWWIAAAALSLLTIGLGQYAAENGEETAVLLGMAPVVLFAVLSIFYAVLMSRSLGRGYLVPLIVLNWPPAMVAFALLRSQRASPAALAAVASCVVASWVASLAAFRIRDLPEKIALRKRMAAARAFFASRLASGEVHEHEEWLPHLIALDFGSSVYARDLPGAWSIVPGVVALADGVAAQKTPLVFTPTPNDRWDRDDRFDHDSSSSSSHDWSSSSDSSSSSSESHSGGGGGGGW